MTQTTLKLTDAQLRFLREGGKLHHQTAKALRRLGLLDHRGDLTTSGEVARDQVRANGSKLVTVPTQDGVTKGDRPATLLTDREQAQLAEAVRTVADNVRLSYPRMTNEEAVEHALNTIALPGKGGPGAVELDLDGTRESRRFRLVLSYPKAVRWLLANNPELAENV